MAARSFALFMGIAFTLAGVGGFLPGITLPPDSDMPTLTASASYGLLLGLFPINLVHNLIHLLFGIWSLAASRGDVTARRYSQVLALTLTVLAVMGLLPMLNITFGALPLFGHDVWLHALEAGAAFYFGFVYKGVHHGYT